MQISYLMPQQRNISKGSKVWYGGISENGIVRWISLKTKNRNVALDWFAKMQASRFSPPTESYERIVLGELISAFIADTEKIRRRAAGTIKNYCSILKSFMRYCEGKGIESIDKLSPVECSEFAQSEFVSLKSSTAQTRIILLRSFFNWAADRYNINMKNPFKKIVVSSTKPMPRLFWTLAECEKIIDAADSEELKCCIALMAYAGLRKEEARNLRIEDIKDGKISVVGKGRKFAKIPISKRLGEYLNRYITLELQNAVAGALFPKLASLIRLRESHIKRIAQKAKVSNADTAHYHRLRHSFASNLLRIGRSIKSVQMLMRHENVTLTLNTYGHLLPSDLEEAVEL